MDTVAGQDSPIVGNHLDAAATAGIRVERGFFWGEGPTVLGGPAFLSGNVVIHVKPRPWQLRRWYRAVRLWLSLI